MKKLALLILALMGQAVFAQQMPVDGEWNCIARPQDTPLRVCSAFCNDQGPGWTVIPPSLECPGSYLGSRDDSIGRCAAILNMTPPLCCPPGVPCVRGATEDPSTSASSSGGSSGTNKALIAGGVVVAAVALYNFVDPDLPDGLTLEPTANLAYRDGLPYSSAALSGEYGNWAFSAASANFGQGWSKPYARVQWAWVF